MTGGRTHPILRATAGYFALGLADAERMVAAAHAALDDEIYSRSLGELITLGNPTENSCEVHFAAALRELGVRVPTLADAVLDVLDHNAVLLAEGAADPTGTLRELHSVEWSLWYVRTPRVSPEVLAPLRPFMTLYHAVEEVREYAAYRGDPELSQADTQRLADLHDECIRLTKQWCRDRWGALLDPTWRTSVVVGLAQAIDRELAFGRLPILADALEEAGCDQAAILTHCRQPGPHVSGCWVVDLVLGKK